MDDKKITLCPLTGDDYFFTNLMYHFDIHQVKDDSYLERLN
jgi:hypothetical protein